MNVEERHKNLTHLFLIACGIHRIHVVTELVIVDVVADDATELLLLATLKFDADVVLLLLLQLFCTNPCVEAVKIAELFCCCVANAACDGLKLDDVLIDLICCC